MLIYESSSVSKTRAFARRIAKILPKIQQSRKSKAFVVRLEGDLGSGKTTFTRALLKALNSRARVVSPTFVLMRKVVLSKKGVFNEAIHIDAYRLQGKEKDALGIKELLKDPKKIILIEWPENLGSLIGRENIIRFFHGENEHVRLIKTNLKI